MKYLPILYPIYFPDIPIGISNYVMVVIFFDIIRAVFIAPSISRFGYFVRILLGIPTKIIPLQ